MSDPNTAYVSVDSIGIRRRASASIAVIGNPNSGKSTLFNRLTGLRQTTGNYPGVTVEMLKKKTTAGINAPTVRPSRNVNTSRNTPPADAANLSVTPLT